MKFYIGQFVVRKNPLPVGNFDRQGQDRQIRYFRVAESKPVDKKVACIDLHTGHDSWPPADMLYEPDLAEIRKCERMWQEVKRKRKRTEAVIEDRNQGDLFK